MAHYRSLEDISIQNSWLTIGVFDGIHRGHQEIIHQLTAGAHANGAPAVVLTFHPHPAVVLGGKKDFKYLTTTDEKAAWLDALGVDTVITIPFDLALARQTAEEFMTRLKARLGLQCLLVGHDFALGRGRAGNAVRLAELGIGLGYSVQVIPPVTDETGIISSTRIRHCIASGQVAQAAEDLGRFYTVSGPVIRGDGRGRKINMPTANLDVPQEKVVPANGVYACWAQIIDPALPEETGQKFPAVTNIGIRPTFTPEEFVPHVETHLLDFDGDLYGKVIRLEFVARLRAEQRFPAVEALITQINSDIARARGILGENRE